ncbi:glutamate racemase [Chelatococcus sp. GCM10030263]|uniref:glutamate racemase n=1 Tax=Chelatococcus sp. GCM10030263 TaxID=3273387 RepID=UPI00361C90B8
MRLDITAGSPGRIAELPMQRPTVLVFDSGLGGLTVFAELLKARPDADFVYAADDAGFPYGRLAEPALVARVVAVMDRLVARFRPDLVVIACNTASTAVLPTLRARHSIPFVGTVPAIKPAAALTRTKRISVIATPGTVKRDYTQGLIASFAADCAVNLVGASRLASLAEAELNGVAVPDVEIAAEIAPAFVQEGGLRTDVVVLACTHYPLLRPRLERLASWPVAWIDPAPAIAKRAVQLLVEQGHTAPEPPALPGEAQAVFTGGATLTPALVAALAARGLSGAGVLTMPLSAEVAAAL